MATDFVRFTDICNLANPNIFLLPPKIIVFTSSCVTQEPRITFEADMLLTFVVICFVFFFNKIELFTIRFTFLSTILGRQYALRVEVSLLHGFNLAFS